MKKMFQKFMRKSWYWLLLLGFIIAAIAIYSSMGNSGKLKDLLKQRPKRKKSNIKLPQKPEIIDYVNLYKDKLSKLK